jgi:hypothetical protein
VTVLTPCSQWPERCPACDGLGGWTARRLEKATGVDWRLYRFLAESRATKTTCVRILDALLLLPFRSTKAPSFQGGDEVRQRRKSLHHL